MALSKVLTRNDLQNVLAHINLGDDAHKEITQAEYDALDQEEKDKDIIYFITDGNPELTIVNDSVPVGAIQAYAGTTPPSNWLICDGRAVNRVKYKQLFDIIGTTYGSGDEETTFNLPNLQGRVVIGQSTTYELGASGGEVTHIHSTANHTLTVSEMPSHDGHLYNNAYYSSGTVTAGEDTYFLASSVVSKYSNTRPFVIRNVNEVAIRGFNKGGGAAHNHGNTGSSSNMQPYLVTNYIIKAMESSIVEKEKLNFLDTFYPIGSCYETQDSNFDPNTEWGGTWEQLDSTFTIVGGMERFDVSGSGGVTIKAAWGSFPTLSKSGTYKMEIECYSSTTSYTITATLGGQTIGTVSSTNGSLHSFINNINGTSGQALGLSITTVNASTHIRVTLHQKDNTYRWHRTA